MAATTLKCLVLKTATVGSAKLPTPADRIGAGATAVMPPANFLSQGQFFMPRLPNPNRVGSRDRVAAMRYEPTAVVPTGPVGSVSGTSACRRSAAPHAAKHATWAGHPWSPSALPRLGCDCQSPDRTDDRKDQQTWQLARTTRAVGLTATAAGK